MQGYKVGAATRAKIFTTCKVLFYEKGYESVSYQDICNASGVNPGTLSYHFKSKSKLVYSVYAQMNDKFITDLSKVFSDEDEITVSLLCLTASIKLLYEDEKFRRFNLDICTYCQNDIYERSYNFGLPFSRVLSEKMTVEKQRYFQTVSTGFDIANTIYIAKHIEDLPIERAMEYTFELYFYFLDRNELKTHILRVYEISKKMKVSWKNCEIYCTV